MNSQGRAIARFFRISAKREGSVLSQTCKKTGLAGAAGRVLAGVLVVAACLALNIHPAVAGKRGVSVGAGIAGAILLNELAKGGGKKKAAKGQRAKKSVATKSKKQRPKEAVPEVEDDAVAVKKDSADSGLAKETITTGSTGAAAKPAAAVTGAGIVSRPDEIKAAQQHLRFMGYDIPQETGAIDAKTKSAVMQFQDSIGAPVTGNLTTEQLQMLFVKVAGKREGS